MSKKGIGPAEYSDEELLHSVVSLVEYLIKVFTKADLHDGHMHSVHDVLWYQEASRRGLI